MRETAYHQTIEKLFHELEIRFAKAEPEIEYDYQAENLVVYLQEDSQLILSRQSALKELWLASPYGAYHFRETNEGWLTSKGEELHTILCALFKKEGITYVI